MTNEQKLRAWVMETFRPENIEDWYSRGDGWGYRSHYATHQPTGIMLNFETARRKSEFSPGCTSALLVSFVKPPGVGLAYRLTDEDGKLQDMWDAMKDPMFKKAEDETAQNILEQIERANKF